MLNLVRLYMLLFDMKKLNHYHLLYLRQEISNELGPLKAQQLFDKSRIGAVAQLRKESAS